MNADEIKQALADAIAPLGRDARAHVGIGTGGDHCGPVFVSAEISWRPGSDKMAGQFCDTIEEAIEAVRAWVADAPMRNRVVCAEDLGLEAA